MTLPPDLWKNIFQWLSYDEKCTFGRCSTASQAMFHACVDYQVVFNFPLAPIELESKLLFVTQSQRLAKLKISLNGITEETEVYFQGLAKQISRCFDVLQAKSPQWKQLLWLEIGFTKWNFSRKYMFLINGELLPFVSSEYKYIKWLCHIRSHMAPIRVNPVLNELYLQVQRNTNPARVEFDSQATYALQKFTLNGDLTPPLLTEFKSHCHLLEQLEHFEVLSTNVNQRFAFPMDAPSRSLLVLSIKKCEVVLTNLLKNYPHLQTLSLTDVKFVNHEPEIPNHTIKTLIVETDGTLEDDHHLLIRKSTQVEALTLVCPCIITNFSLQSMHHSLVELNLVAAGLRDNLDLAAFKKLKTVKLNGPGISGVYFSTASSSVKSIALHGDFYRHPRSVVGFETFINKCPLLEDLSMIWLDTRPQGFPLYETTTLDLLSLKNLKKLSVGSCETLTSISLQNLPELLVANCGTMTDIFVMDAAYHGQVLLEAKDGEQSMQLHSRQIIVKSCPRLRITGS